MTTPAPNAPTPAVGSQAPTYGGSIGPAAISAPWSATGLTSLGLGATTTTQDKEANNTVSYKGQVLPYDQAMQEYNSDLAAYNQSKGAATAPIKPNYQDFYDAELGNVPKGTALNADALEQVKLKAQADYTSAMGDYQNQLSDYESGVNAGQSPMLGGGGHSLLDQGAPAQPIPPSMADTINQQFSTMSNDQINALQRRLQIAGYLTGRYTPGYGDDSTVKAFANLLLDVNEQLPKDPSLTWTAMLTNAVKQSGWTVLPNGDYQRTSQKEPTLNPVAAQAGFNKSIGRDGSPQEIQNFIDTYQKIMAQNPLSTIQTMDKAGNVETTAPTLAIQSQTVDQAQLQAAQQNPDYATYQAATTYWNALQNALQPMAQVQNNLK